MVGWGVETLQRCNVVSNMKKKTQNSKARGCERDEKKKLHISDWLNWRKGDLVDVWLIFKKSWEIIFIYTYIHKSESTMKRLKMKNKTVTWKVNSNWCLVSFFCSFLQFFVVFFFFFLLILFLSFVCWYRRLLRTILILGLDWLFSFGYFVVAFIRICTKLRGR